MFESFEAVAGRVRLRLVGLDVSGVAGLRLDAAGHPGSRQAVLALAPGVGVGAVIDDGDRLVQVSVDMVDAWGVGFGEVVAAGARAFSGRAVETSQVQPGTWILSDPEQIAVAILDSATIDGFQVTGRPVVIPVAQDLLVLVGSDDHDGLGKAVRAALDASQAVRVPVSGWPLTVAADGSRWQGYAWAADLNVGFSQLTRSWDARWYGAQREVLGETTAAGRFVPAVELAQGRDGSYVTYCSLPAGVEALLPRVDFVHTVSDDGTVHPHPWQQMIDTYGAALTDTGVHPALRIAPANTITG
ncbi:MULTISPECIES: hypothetical protein [unclassified Pseudoclavibacter]|uniref:hypothetical protein n=1 Tax=unclassified Pseudoclavibacter TaxID=2615177 RepID=UPI00130128EE|nr:MULTISPECIES: hypothetical protein [unclassified Pseudoclavibacter]KAB1645471.1 hypothetical protein F8O06_07725 [Pseudoclavibacter sp. CFCC 14310]KAB1646070.1 hypothetical protein F8O06_04720 [Pseudoclavibacter sp. CFCC 14310]KAB1663622.1 hypothetical protein F8O08_07825 [Pseudoclavibacter sp. CFCC 13611]